MTSQFESYHRATDSQQIAAKTTVCEALKRRQPLDKAYYLERGRQARSHQAHAMIRSIAERIRRLLAR